ncbi:MAG: hypothetical protein JWO94_3719 [Verrucomicrobiaceae bacterium]|nr:hypothetical protein [Verrucomicrobiaceae bacterium]
MMNLRLILPLLAGLLLMASCAHPVQVYHIGDIIPAGCRIEYYAQVGDGSWKPTLQQACLPRPMHIKEAEKWALSAAQQRLGREWKDYCIRVIPPGGKPVVVWQRLQTVHL